MKTGLIFLATSALVAAQENDSPLDDLRNIPGLEDVDLGNLGDLTASLPTLPTDVPSNLLQVPSCVMSARPTSMPESECEINWSDFNLSQLEESAKELKDTAACYCGELRRMMKELENECDDGELDGWTGSVESLCSGIGATGSMTGSATTTMDTTVVSPTATVTSPVTTPTGTETVTETDGPSSTGGAGSGDEDDDSEDGSSEGGDAEDAAGKPVVGLVAAALAIMAAL